MHDYDDQIVTVDVLAISAAEIRLEIIGWLGNGSYARKCTERQYPSAYVRNITWN